MIYSEKTRFMTQFPLASGSGGGIPLTPNGSKNTFFSTRPEPRPQKTLKITKKGSFFNFWGGRFL